MDNINGMLAFVRAAQLQSFTAAGERLGISASAVGKSVARLEARLNVRLFNRSTRRISLTDEGQLFFERCQRIVAQMEEAENELSRLSSTPRGKLRVSLPHIGYRMLLPYLPEFMQRYPEVELELDFTDRLVDIIAEGVDVAIRSGDLVDSEMMSRILGTFRFVIVASPDYLSRHPAPERPEDLQQHVCLRYRFLKNGQLQTWDFADARPREIPASLTFNNLEGLLQASVRGMGLTYAPKFLVKEYLHSGELVSVLDDYITDAGKFSLVWPSSRHLLPKIRVFIDFMTEKKVLSDL
ncbi:LysR family transcriptional regulator [Rouxiella chamberiensis]|uniref:LysR family transcriptional regulator n=1 Tax=Rouxiella chamberiensis TaxID=1513468 RepID=A0ABY7HNX8_9GAMM|nr:LysR family transcriptional regulator [Rouxiella chamberiensis]WAT01087.1 LysR family transcriptional regulator [Rouxiella chamberiensis]